MLHSILFYLHISLFPQLVTVFALHAKAWMFQSQPKVVPLLPIDWQNVRVSWVLKYNNYKRILDRISGSVCIECLSNHADN